MIRYDSNSSFRPGLLCIEGKPKPGTIKYRYLRENRNVNFINKVSYNLHDYKLTFNLEKIPKNKWRKLIQKHQELEDELLKDMVHIDDFKVPDEWVKENRWKWTPASPNRSTSTITYKKDGEIPMKEVVVGDRDPFIWETSYLSANDIKREFIVYGDKDDKDVLKDIKAMLYKRHVGIKVCLLSKRNISYIKHKNNFISTDEFFVKFEKYIRKLVTAHIVNEEFFRKTEFKDRTNIGRMWFYRNSISYRLVSYISNHYVSWFNPTLRKLIVEYEKSSNLDYDVLSDLAKFKNFRDSYYKIIGFNINSHSTGESEIYAFIESLKRHFYNIHKRGKMFFPNLKIDYKLYCKK